MKEQRRRDRRSAAVECALYNIHRDRKAQRAPYRVDEFMPVYESDDEASKAKKDRDRIKNKIVGMHSRYTAVSRHGA